MIIKCDENIEGVRLDRFLRKNLKNKSLNKIFEYIRTGKVKVNGKKKKENYRLVLGDIIELKYLGEDSIVVPEKSFFQKKIDTKKYIKMIFFEDENYLVINKPAGIAMHKGTGNEYGLAEAFKYIYKNNDINFANRIDKETKGLVLGAKNLKSLRYLTQKIREDNLSKKYIAVVKGIIEKEKFEIENFLEIKEDKVIVSNSSRGKRAKSIFKKLKVIKDKYTVLEVEIVTGRKHQIRVQLQNFGYPIVGDRKYGDKNVKTEFMLLAYYLKFDDYIFKIDYSNFLDIL